MLKAEVISEICWMDWKMHKTIRMVKNLQKKKKNSKAEKDKKLNVWKAEKAENWILEKVEKP